MLVLQWSLGMIVCGSAAFGGPLPTAPIPLGGENMAVMQVAGTDAGLNEWAKGFRSRAIAAGISAAGPVGVFNFSSTESHRPVAARESR